MPATELFNTPETERQTESAETLIAMFVNCGIDEVSTLDLLDCLASVGLRLTPDPEGVASLAYFARIKSALDEANR